MQYYVDLIIDQMDKETLAALEKSPQGFAVKIKQYVTSLLEEHNMREFNHWLEIGRAWQNAAGAQYKYFMVFQNKDLKLDGAVQFDQFAELLKEL